MTSRHSTHQQKTAKKLDPHITLKKIQRLLNGYERKKGFLRKRFGNQADMITLLSFTKEYDGINRPFAIKEKNEFYIKLITLLGASNTLPGHASDQVVKSLQKHLGGQRIKAVKALESIQYYGLTHILNSPNEMAQEISDSLLSLKEIHYHGIAFIVRCPSDYIKNLSDAFLVLRKSSIKSTKEFNWAKKLRELVESDVNNQTNRTKAVCAALKTLAAGVLQHGVSRKNLLTPFNAKWIFENPQDAILISTLYRAATLNHFQTDNESNMKELLLVFKALREANEYCPELFSHHTAEIHQLIFENSPRAKTIAQSLNRLNKTNQLNYEEFVKVCRDQTKNRKFMPFFKNVKNNTETLKEPRIHNKPIVRFV